MQWKRNRPCLFMCFVYLFFIYYFICITNTVRSESRCALIKTRSSIERIVTSKNWIKQLHTLPVLHFNRCLTTEYSETTAHFSGNFDTDKPNLRTVAEEHSDFPNTLYKAIVLWTKSCTQQ
jgi:hypothetical protein